MRILFVKLSSIGDVIHTLPAFALVKKALPDADIDWVVESRAAEILQQNPAIANLIEVDTRKLRRMANMRDSVRGAKGDFETLRKFNYDLSLDFQGNFKSATLARIARVDTRYGFERSQLREPASRVLLDTTIPVAPHINVIKKNIMFAQSALKRHLQNALFELDDEIKFPLETSKIHKDEATNIAKEIATDFAILNPAGGWDTKLWSPEKYGELADKLWYEFKIASIVTTAENETNLAQRVLAQSQSGFTISAQPTLKGFYELARLARIYIGGDTAPTHLAVAAKTPVVGLFGPTEWWRNGSIDKEDICVQRNDIDCRDNCHRRTCNNWICMEIPVEATLRAVAKRLKLETPPK